MVLIDYFADGLKPGLIKWNVPGAAKVPEINYYLFVVFFFVCFGCMAWITGAPHQGLNLGSHGSEKCQVLTTRLPDNFNKLVSCGKIKPKNLGRFGISQLCSLRRYRKYF